MPMFIAQPEPLVASPRPPIPTLLNANARPCCRVFVSYSHRDMDNGREFLKYFYLKLAELTQLGIEPEQVFFDRNELLAGDEWDESIQRSLEQAEYFIYLVSADSLTSKYCRQRELAVAIERRIPIVPIILKKCPWEGQALPRDPRNRCLKDLGALPKDSSFALRPVSEWPGDPANVWTEVVEQLAKRMERDHRSAAVPPAPPNGIRASAKSRLIPVLPYFCDQVGLVSHFNGRVRDWDSSVLLVLTRGHPDDNVPRFWDRLRIKNLADYLTLHNGQLLEAKPWVWPQEAERRSRASELANDMLATLSDALTGNAFQLHDPAMLAHWLTSLNGVMPLVTTLPRQKKSALALGLRVLLDMLEKCLLNVPLHRLVLTAVIEDDALANERDLIKSLKLTGYECTHVVDLMPLQEIAEDDIRRWHREHEVHTLCRLSEEELLSRVFAEHAPRRLRLGTFDARLKPILGS